MGDYFFRSDCDEDDNDENDANTTAAANSDRIYSYLVEQCLQSAQNNRVIFCPVHGNMGPFFVASADGRVTSAHAAPDAVRSSHVIKRRTKAAVLTWHQRAGVKLWKKVTGRGFWVGIKINGFPFSWNVLEKVDIHVSVSCISVCDLPLLWCQKAPHNSWRCLNMYTGLWSFEWNILALN